MASVHWKPNSRGGENIIYRLKNMAVNGWTALEDGRHAAWIRTSNINHQIGNYSTQEDAREAVTSFCMCLLGPHLSRVPNVAIHAFNTGVELVGQGHWHPAGTEFRRAVELAIRELYPKSNKSLHKRIKSAIDERVLPRDLAPALHDLRRLGNKAAHECSFERGEAMRLKLLAEYFLRSAFELPSILREISVENS